MHHELRRFFRCPIPQQHARGQLIIAGRKWDCAIRNVSIGGFGVELPSAMNLTGIESAALKTAEGAIPVKIVHVSVNDHTTTIGLERISEPDRKQVAEQQQRQLRRFQLALACLAVLFFAGLVLFERSGGYATMQGRQPGWLGLVARGNGSDAGKGARASTSAPRGNGLTPFGPQLAPSRPPLSTVRSPLGGHTTATPLAVRAPSSGSGAVLTNWTPASAAASPAAVSSNGFAGGTTSAARASASSSRLSTGSNSQTYRFSTTALSELSRWSTSPKATGDAHQKMNVLNGMLAEAAALSTNMPAGQVRTVTRDGLRIELRFTASGLEVLSVQTE